MLSHYTPSHAAQQSRDSGTRDGLVETRRYLLGPRFSPPRLRTRAEWPSVEGLSLMGVVLLLVVIVAFGAGAVWLVAVLPSWLGCWLLCEYLFGPKADRANAYALWFCRAFVIVVATICLTAVLSDQSSARPPTRPSAFALEGIPSNFQSDTRVASESRPPAPWHPVDAVGSSATMQSSD